jgi:hypothetical protein
MGEWRYSSTILDLGIRWSCQLPTRDRSPGSRWIEDWVGPRADLGSTEKRNNILPLPRIETGRPAGSLISVPTEEARVPTPEYIASNRKFCEYVIDKGFGKKWL